MLYLLGILVAIQLVAGQALWKIAVTRAQLQLTFDYLFSPKVFQLLFSPYFIAGTIIYIVATFMYLGMLTKFQYSTVQALIVPASLIAAFLLAQFGFHERLGTTNYIGLLVLILGITLATRR